MELHVITVVLGLIGLFLGGNWLVKGAARLASSFGVSALVIGITIVAWATSAPELVVNLDAAIQGTTDVAIGNVLGSNAANTGLTLGMVALLFGIAVQADLIRRELPIMLGATILLLALAADRELGALDGVIMLACFIAFSVIVLRAAIRQRDGLNRAYTDYEADEGLTTPRTNRLLEVGRIAAGVALLIVGANLTVSGSVAIARAVGVSEFLIGLTLVAVGTSLPEIAASMSAAAHGQTDILIGNLVGSNIANILLILGVTSIVRPMPVSAPAFQIDMPILVLMAGIVLLFARGSRLHRREGALLLLVYIGFMAVAFIR